MPSGFDENQGQRHGGRPRGPMDPRPITVPEPELTHESGVYSVVMPFFGRIEQLRYRADCWSIRIWHDGDDPAYAEEVMFPTAVDPTSVVVRLQNGVLEFLVAGTEVVCGAFDGCPPDPDT